MKKLNLELLQEKFSDLNICLNDLQKNQFSEYYSYMIEENSKKNLTRITEEKEVVLKHYIDSVFISKYINFRDNLDLKIVDLGAGAGFPSIPLKICFPQIRVSMIDSVNKKVVFLEECIERLGLDGAEAICARAENILKDEEYREGFDFCVSRAVAELRILAEYCIPFVKEGGYFVAYKSGSASEEIRQAENAVSVLGGRVERIEEFCLPGTEDKRTLIFIKKIKRTESKYPRREGIPSKRPL